MATYYVGWDVGAWGCENKATAASHDAIAVFDERFELVSYGCGNVKDKLQGSKDFANFLFKFAPAEKYTFSYDVDRFIIAIDAVLGWPKNFLRLVTEPKISKEELDALFPEEEHIYNKFVFRETERTVKGIMTRDPLSAVKDQIGSQSTKAIFLLKYLGFSKAGCSHWIDEYGNIAIETYPSTLDNQRLGIPKKEILEGQLPQIIYSQEDVKKNRLFGGNVNEDGDKVTTVDVDLQDAIVCAWVAKEHTEGRCGVPNQDVVENYASEGWIFIPKSDPATETAEN